MKQRSEAMSSTVHAVYEKGVFRPLEPVGLPDNTPVEFEPRVLTEVPQPLPPSMSDGLAKVYEILGRPYSSGQTDTAALHHEHQP